MPVVRLRKDGPARLHTQGFLFERGEPRDDIPLEVCRELLSDRRFKIDFTAGEAPPKAATVEGRGDMKGRPNILRDRLNAIRDAIADLDVDDEDNYTAEGKPDARILSSMLGWSVTAEERDMAIKPQDVEADKPQSRTGKITLTRRAKAAQTDALIDSGEDVLVDDEEAVEA